MARLCCVFVCQIAIILTIFQFCNSIESPKSSYKYETISNLKYIETPILRIKRQTLPDLPQPNVTVIDTNAIKQNGSSEISKSNVETSSMDKIDNTYKIQPLLGVNGTGQRKILETTAIPPPVVSEPINSHENLEPTLTLTDTLSNGQGKLLLDDNFVKDIDIATNDTSISASHNITEVKTDYFQYYNSSTVVDIEKAQDLLQELENFTANTLLSKSHRRAITIQLLFDFPFYGHPVRNITIATGGFLYTGEYVHSWLAATQYIAPLMANFDTSLSNDSNIKYRDNGTSFTVFWEKVLLQDHTDYGSFTFSVTLHQNGDIVFVYYSLPIQIATIIDEKHPVKIGVSDAYIIDKTIFFARRKTIYEYHRVNFDSQDVRNATIIYLSAQPTCIQHTNCDDCLTFAESTTFKCYWCPVTNRCSTGTDRKRQEWVYNDCDKHHIMQTQQCPALGTKGNNYSTEQEIHTKDTDGESGMKYVSNQDAVTMYEKDQNQKTDETISSSSHSMQLASSRESTSYGFVLGIFIPLAMIMCLAMWIFYAFRNPHTKSGQLLIQYRPSQWSWRRGEARYTAATIHM